MLRVQIRYAAAPARVASEFFYDSTPHPISSSAFAMDKTTLLNQHHTPRIYMSSIRDRDAEEELRAGAKIVRQGEQELHDVLNPYDLEAAARAVFPENKFAKALLEEFFIHEFTYA
ncbi:hypothetical protein GQ44DRAFT_780538 [Phaeosphaeriaceae sp. PMI808]|nr:hypothetical protein GQ44DRAFT_780538 [Phaeosphaeriaceae sp. PMI808]